MARTPLLVLLAAVLLAGAAAPSDSPPVAPENETPVQDPPTPPAACIKAVMDVVNHEGGKLSRTMTTRSARFGDVWRADFTTPGYDPQLISRAICWADQVQLVIRQRIAPLPVARPGRHPASIRCQYTSLDNPCRGDPVSLVWLCVRPGLLLYADGRTEIGQPDALNVNFLDRNEAETDDAWARRCATHGGVHRAQN
jgi:hypothetical protein